MDTDNNNNNSKSEAVMKDFLSILINCNRSNPNGAVNKINSACVENIQQWNETIEDIFAETALQVTVLAIITLLSVISNSLVLIVFYRRPSLLSKSNRFVLNLSLCNFFMGMLVMPVVMLNTYWGMWSLGPLMCDIFSVMITVLICVSSLTLFCITVDRYIAVAKPLHYKRKLTTKKTYSSISATWIVSILFSIIPFMGMDNVYDSNMKICFIDLHSRSIISKFYIWGFSALCFIIPLGFMLCVYVNIFGATKRSTAKVRRFSINPESSDIGTLTLHDIVPIRAGSESPPSNLQQTYLRITASNMKKIYVRLFHKDDWKAAITGFMCVSTFTITWIPFFLIITLKVSLTVQFPKWIEAGVIYIAFLSCILNPLVYVFRSQYVKKELGLLVKRRKSSAASGTYPLIKESTNLFDSSSPARSKYSRRSVPIINHDFELRKPLTHDFSLKSSIIIDENDSQFLTAEEEKGYENNRNSFISIKSA